MAELLWSAHAQARARERGIAPEAMALAVRHGRATVKEDGSTVYPRHLRRGAAGGGAARLRGAGGGRRARRRADHGLPLDAAAGAPAVVALTGHTLARRWVDRGWGLARPDCDDGWIKLAHELHAAITASGLNHAARVVLCEALEQVYGPAKRRHAVLSPSDIGRRFGGRPKQWADRGISECEDGGMLDRQPGGKYRFVKDYESWRSPQGGALFSAGELEWIREAPARALNCAGRAGREASSKMMTNGSDQHESVIIFDDPTNVSVNGLDDVSPAPLINPPAYRENCGRREEDKNPLPPAAAEAAADDADAVSDWAESLPGAESEYLGGKARAMCAGYPAEWVRAALVVAVVSAAPGRRAAFAVKVLIRWKARGGMDAAEVAAASAGGPASPTLDREQRLAAMRAARERIDRALGAPGQGGARP
jgi:hypothetical protein